MQNVSRSNVAASCALSPSSVQRSSATSRRTQKRLAANNSLVSRLLRLVGSYLIAPAESRPDETELFNFLRNHHIVVPSTPGRPPRPTVLNLEQGESRTQVDYIMTREATAGRPAKRSSPPPPLFSGSWKTGGHLPVTARVPPMRHWQLPGPIFKPLSHDARPGQSAVRSNQQQAQTMVACVQERLREDMLSEWDELLSQATHWEGCSQAPGSWTPCYALPSWAALPWAA